MKRTIKFVAIAVSALAATLLAWFIWIGGLAYIYALHLEGNWSKANPKTKAELEQHLHLYSLRQIEPSTSMWGNRYHLREDERMMQYLILWSAPLDVVYDNHNSIKAIFTSYE